MAVDEIGARLRLRDRARFSSEARRAAADVDNLGDAADRTSRSAGRATRALQRMQRATRPVGAAMLVAGRAVRTGLMLAIPAIAAAGTAMVNMASDAAETRSALETVAGGAIDAVDKGLDKLYKTSSLTRQEMEQGAVNFLTMGRGADFTGRKLGQFATGMVSAAGDLGSFFNAAQPEVLEALRSGLSGEAEPLRKFGIFLSDAALNAFALEQGISKTTQEMSEGEKIALRQQFIMENLGAAQGDAARTADGFANKSRRLWRDIKDLATQIGTGLMPTADRMLEWLSGIVDDYGPQVAKWAETLPERIENLATSVGGFVDRARPVAGMLGEWWPLLAGVAAAFIVAAAATAVWTAALAINPIMLIITAIGLLIGWLFKLYRENETAASKMRNVWYALSNVFSAVGLMILTSIEAIVAGVLTMVSTILNGLAMVARATGANEAARKLDNMRDSVDDARAGWDRFRESSRRKLETNINSNAAKIAYERLQRLNAELDRTVASRLVTAVGEGAAGSLLRQEAAMANQGRATRPRAMGGPTWPGGTFLVGERGPELWHMGVSAPRGFVQPLPRMPAVNVSVKGGDGATAGPVTFAPGSIVVQGASDPRATAEAVARQVSSKLARR